MPRNIVYIGNKLAAHGFTPTNIDTLGPLLESEGYDVVYGGTRKNFFFRLVEMAMVVLKNRKTAGAVIVDTYSTLAFLYAYMVAVLCTRFKIPFIPILHGGNLPARIAKSPKMADKVFRESYRNIVLSGYLGKVLDEKGIPYDVIFNNIDLSAYAFRHRSALQPTLLWVRSFHEVYRPEMAIMVLAKVRETFPDAKLCMVGPDKDGSLERCRGLVADLALESCVTFTGKLTKADWLERAANFDIFINTTNFDNLPVSIIEAQALGFPIVSTDVGGIPYLITDGVDGVLTPVGDVDAMAGKVTALLANPELAGKLSANARLSAERFDWGKIKLQWNDLLRPLVV